MMKNYFLLFLIFANSYFTFAQKQTLFSDNDVNITIKQANTQNKPIVLMFYATWCEHCKKMKADVFTDQDVIDYYSANFICTAIDAESQYGNYIKNKYANKFKIVSFPTFVFLDKNENLLSCNSGEFKKDEFIKEGKNALLPENQISTFKTIFNADVSNADNCLKYISAVRKTNLDTSPIARQYLNTVPKQNLISETNWRILAYGINDIEADEIKHIIANKEGFAKATSQKRVERKLTFMTTDNLFPLAEVGDTLNYFKKRRIAESFQIRKVDSLLFRYDLSILEKVKDWKKYKKASESAVEKFGWNDSNVLVEISKDYLTYIDDKKGISNAINWTKQALTLGESLEKYILISKLYLKNNDLKNANDFAEKGKTIAINYGWKTNELDNLILEAKNRKLQK